MWWVARRHNGRPDSTVGMAQSLVHRCAVSVGFNTGGSALLPPTVNIATLHEIFVAIAT